MENIAISENNKKLIKSRKKNVIAEWSRFIIFILLLAMVIPNSVGFMTISGLSMFPTFKDGNLILEEKVSKYFTSPEIGDVVIINREKEQGYKIVKRVIGLPGDTVEIKRGIVYVNKTPIPEIMTEGTPTDIASIKIPEKHIFVMGDNRTQGESIDSRDPSVGPISLSEIDGYVLFSLSPFKVIPKPINLEK
jgi:signal peptidase I